MTLYFDTSALVKLFSRETGSASIQEMVLNPENEIWVLELANIELTCAVYRKLRNGEILKSNLEAILAAIDLQFQSMRTINLASDILTESRHLMAQFGAKYGLRTLDALHVAGFTLFAEPDWKFVSADKNQLNVVKQLQHHTITVNKSQ
jgi:uncharacterized protein